MEILIAITLGILGSIIASFIMIFMMFNIKPKISISPEIAWGKNNDGITTYKIKVVNNSKRPVIDLQAELQIVRLFNTPTGISKDSLNIPLRKAQVMMLSSYGKSNHSDDFSFRFLTEEPLMDKWEDKNGSFLRFHLRATDSLSGHTSVISKLYYMKSASLIHGIHEDGRSLSVVKSS